VPEPNGATPSEMDEIERDIRRWGRGCILIDVNETGRRLLRILPAAVTQRRRL
jgi:hypothetical protein